MEFNPPQIYPITDRALSGLSHPEQVKRIIDAGARFIQIRDKSASGRELYDAVCESLKIARSAGAKIILNDRVDMARATGAYGVHVGRGDLPAALAREILGPEAIIGVSTHTLEELRIVIALPVNYVAFGPIFSTNSKVDTEPVVGLELLRQAREIAVDVPLIAIGGITASNIRSVVDTGCDSAALISAVVGGSADIATNLLRLQTKLT